MGFAQEVRDFVSGFKAGSDMVNDVQDRKAGRAQAAIDAEYKARQDARQERAANRADEELKASAEHRRKQLELQAAGQASRDKYYDRSLAIREQQSKRERAPTAAELKAQRDAEAAEYSDDDYQFENILIQKNGGLVEEPEVVRARKGDMQGALPVTPEVTKAPVQDPVQKPVQASAMPDMAGEAAPQQTKSPEAADAAEAREAGVDAINEQMAEQAATPEQESALPTNKPRKVSMYQNALTPEENKLIMQQIDPDGKLPSELKQLRKMGRMYRYWVQQGDMKKAKDAAAAVLLESQVMASQYGASALEELRAGNVAKGAAILEAGYNNWVPDGKKVEVNESGIAVFKDAETGELLAQGKLSPQFMVKMAMGLKDGSAFWQALKEASGQKEEQPKDPKATSAVDVESNTNQIDALQERFTEMAKGKQIPRAVAALAYDVARYNGGDTATAADAIFRSLDETPPGSGRAPFQLNKTETGYELTTRYGKFNLPESSLNAVQGVRQWYESMGR